MNDNYRWRPEWIKSPGWIFAEVPDAVRSELETCINERGGDARNTLGGHLEQSWHIPIKEHTKAFTKDLSWNYIKEFGTTLSMGFGEELHDPEKVDFELKKLWVNYQKKHDFNPLHIHSGIFSFAIWVVIPYDMKKEKERYKECNNNETASFQFQWNSPLGGLDAQHIPLDKSWEWKMALFPSRMYHGVNPFYTSDDYRVSISGNLYIVDR